MKPETMQIMLDALKYADEVSTDIELIIRGTIKNKISEDDALKRINYTMQACGLVSDTLRRASNCITGGENGNQSVRRETRGG